MSPVQTASPIRLSRLSRRLLQHHLPLFVLSAACVALLYATRPYKDIVTKASFATAYPALVLLAATLLIGPLNLIRRRPNPVSSDLRRDLGIWAGILGVIHAGVGQCVHLRGRPWLYYVYGPWEHHHTFPLRHDIFGLANYTGAIGTLILAALLATSNDLSLRTMRVPQWKKLQRWNYIIFALVAIHGFAYQATEKQDWRFVFVAIVSVAVAMGFQLFGIAWNRLAVAKQV